MSFKQIALKRGTQITSVVEGREFIDRNVDRSRRSEPLWDSAITEINNAVKDPTRTTEARAALYKALVADNLV
jgi:hypothetical protein